MHIYLNNTSIFIHDSKPCLNDQQSSYKLKKLNILG